MNPNLLHPTQIARAKILIDEIIHHLNLDLRGLNVLTEMGSNYYIYTPLIAAMAGAEKVYSLVKNSRHGTIQEILDVGKVLIDAWNLRKRIKIITSLTKDIISYADIVTNLGFIRPIDQTFILFMKKGAVIPYMREAWEYRKEDVDLVACRKNNIPVMGTNENYDGLNIFAMCGPLVLKMLFSAGLEVRKNYVAVFSRDKFGDTIFNYLKSCDVDVIQINNREQINIKNIKRLDAIIIAEYHSGESLIGLNGWIKPSDLATNHPECTIIRFCGTVDIEALKKYQIRYFPEYPIEDFHMGFTLAELGPKPVIDLHAAGLKVGELMWKTFHQFNDAIQVIDHLTHSEPICQPIPQFIDQYSFAV